MKREYKSNCSNNMSRVTVNIFNIDAPVRGSSNVWRKCTIRMKIASHVILLLFALCPALIVGEDDHLFRNPRSQQRSKWEAPCGHRERISDLYGQQLPSAVGNRDRTTSNAIRNIGDMAQCLASKLLSLKAVYAQKRFNDSELVSDLESHMFQLNGRPKPRGVSQRTDSLDETLRIIRLSAEDVGRMVAYWEMAENGERFDEPGETFENQFRTIATDSQCGLYWILCHMHMIMEEFERQPYSAGARQEIKQIEQNEVANSRAARHWRDYLVMVCLHKLLLKVKREMQVAQDSLK